MHVSMLYKAVFGRHPLDLFIEVKWGTLFFAFKRNTFPHLAVALGPFQTSNFTCAESNANERKQ